MEGQITVAFPHHLKPGTAYLYQVCIAAISDGKEKQLVSVAGPRLVFQTRQLSLSIREIPGILKDQH